MVAHYAYLAEQRSRVATQDRGAARRRGGIAASGQRRRRLQLDLNERERSRAEAQATPRRARQGGGERAEAERAAEERDAQVTAELGRLQGGMSELKARETERGLVLTVSNELLFDSGGATLKPGGAGPSRTSPSSCRSIPTAPSRSKASPTAPAQKEQPAGCRRSAPGRREAALVARGISPKRIEARGYGPRTRSRRTTRRSAVSSTAAWKS